MSHDFTARKRTDYNLSIIVYFPAVPMLLPVTVEIVSEELKSWLSYHLLLFCTTTARLNLRVDFLMSLYLTHRSSVSETQEILPSARLCGTHGSYLAAYILTALFQCQYSILKSHADDDSLVLRVYVCIYIYIYISNVLIPTIKTVQKRSRLTLRDHFRQLREYLGNVNLHTLDTFM
jgi:uncharacterized membrane protein